MGRPPRPPRRTGDGAGPADPGAGSADGFAEPIVVEHLCLHDLLSIGQLSAAAGAVSSDVLSTVAKRFVLGKGADVVPGAIVELARDFARGDRVEIEVAQEK